MCTNPPTCLPLRLRTHIQVSTARAPIPLRHLESGPPRAQIHQLASSTAQNTHTGVNSESAHPTTPPRIRSASEMWGSRSILLAQMRRGVVARSLSVQHGGGACTSKQGVGGRGVVAQHQGPPHTHLFSSRRCSSFLATGICSRCSNEHVCAAMVGGGGARKETPSSSLNSG